MDDDGGLWVDGWEGKDQNDSTAIVNNGLM